MEAERQRCAAEVAARDEQRKAAEKAAEAREAALRVEVVAAEERAAALCDAVQAAGQRGDRSSSDPVLVRRAATLCAAAEPGCLRVEARRGRAVMFPARDLGGRYDAQTWHAGCPVPVGSRKRTLQFFKEGDVSCLEQLEKHHHSALDEL